MYNSKYDGAAIESKLDSIRDNYAIKTVSVASGQLNMQANTYYRNSANVSGALTLAFQTPADATIANEYIVEFYVSASSVSLTMPSGIVWANDDVPTIEAGNTYVVSVVNNLAVYIKTPHKL